MIPRLDYLGRPCADEPRWIKTKADDELKDCVSLSISVHTPNGVKKYPVWKFMEMYCLIMDAEGHMSPLRLKKAQIETYKLWDEQYREKGYVRCNEGKGRQMGSSTLIHAFLFSWMITHPGFKVGILADTEEKGKALLDKYKVFFANLPVALKGQLDKILSADNASRLEFDYGRGIKSSVEVIVANDRAGASKTFQAIHESEVALWENIKATIAALERTVATASDTFIFRETTARGPNDWKEIYEKGKRRVDRFRSIFLGWFLDEKYSEAYDGHPLDEYEKRLQSMGLSLDQIQWWHVESSSMGMDFMKHEFPSFESEMWEGTSISIFDAGIVSRRKEEVKEPIRQGRFVYEIPKVVGDDFDSELVLKEATFDPYSEPRVRIYEEPIEGHPYAIANDPAEGGTDYHATLVVDCSNCRLVALYHARGEQESQDQSAFSAYCLWLYYRYGGMGKDGKVNTKSDFPNRVFVTGERNRTTYWLHMMDRLGAGPISRDMSDGEAQSYLNYLGWRTTQTNRNAMIDEFKIAFRDSNGEIATDLDLLDEMETFQYRKSGIQQKEKAQAVGSDSHDDLIMAYCGFFHCLRRGDFECNIEKRPKQGKLSVRFDPFSKQETQKNDKFQVW